MGEEKKKRKKPVQVTQRSLKHLRQHGYLCQVIERWNAFAKIRVDLFGFIDIVAVERSGLFGIQVTTQNNHATRRNKIQQLGEARTWLEAGGRILIHSWKKKQKGGRQVWEVRIEEITREMLVPEAESVTYTEMKKQAKEQRAGSSHKA